MASGVRSDEGNASTGGAPKKVALVTIAILALTAGGAALAYVFPSASNQGFAPEQPIPFSHKLHSGDNQIACQYCHVGVETSKHATVPTLNVCMNCHSVVKVDSPWIQKLQKHYREGKPIEWTRVHELPDFVTFPHYKHVNKGVSCETCHGDVAKMDVMYQAKPLTMGWCLDCHQGQTTPKDVLQRIYPGVENPHGPAASISCSVCHY